jgi:type II secretory pathway pseudopilin PulG
MMLWLLFFVAAMGVGMAAVGVQWHSVSQREKERQLLFVGDQYRRALESYAKAVPASEGKTAAQYPKSLDDLLLDPRFQHTVRHLRRLYRDPVTGKDEWGLLRDGQGGIIGIHSLSELTPFKRAGFPATYPDFDGKDAYRQWLFAPAATNAIAVTPAAAESAATDANNPTSNTNPGNPPASAPDEAQLARLACLQEKERTVSTECTLLQGQDQRICHNQAFQRYRACLSGN